MDHLQVNIVAWYLWYKKNTGVYDKQDDFKCSSKSLFFLVFYTLNEGHCGKVIYVGSEALERSRAMEAENFYSRKNRRDMKRNQSIGCFKVGGNL